MGKAKKGERFPQDSLEQGERREGDDKLEQEED